MIWGYPDRQSVFPGETLTWHISTTATQFRIDFYRQGQRLIYQTSSPLWQGRFRNPTIHPSIASTTDPSIDWGFFSEEFPPNGRPYVFTIPANWPSGVYVAAFIEGDGQLPPAGAVTSADGSDKNFFVVKSSRPASSTSILYKLSTNTYHAYNAPGESSAYNAPGGSSLYEATVNNPGNNPAGQKVSMHRPRVEQSNDLRQSGFVLSVRDAPFIGWLEAAGYTVEYCTDLDLHEAPQLLTPYHLLLSVGHDEYWSQDMRAHVEAFIVQGGNVAFLSGNTCWWCIHYVDFGADGHPTAFVCATDHGVNYNIFTPDPHTPTSLPLDQWPPALDQWWRPTPYGLGKPENTMTGVSYRNTGVRHGAKLGYTVQYADHWVYEGTGLKNGDVFGQEAELVGYECDGAAYRLDDQGIAHPIGLDGTPSTFLILGLADISTSVAECTDPAFAANEPDCSQPAPAGQPTTAELQTALIYSTTPKWGWVCPPREPEVEAATGQKRAATMGIYPAPGGGTVFTAATVDWAEVLGSRREPHVEQITRNVLSHLMGRQQSGRGVFNQVDDQRALIPLSEHKDWSPFWRAIVPGSFANQSWLQLLFYDPVSRVGEFYTSNGRGLLTLLKRNEGWKLWSLIIPGKFSQNAYTDLLFYDPFYGVGEFYGCNGDGTITLLRRNEGWSKLWSLIIPGKFSQNAYTGLLFYDPFYGVGEFYTCNGDGTITLLRRNEGWRKTWSLIIPGKFSQNAYTDLLFYDPVNGVGEFYTCNGDGTITLLRRNEGWRKTWSLIVPGSFSESGYTDLLFYDPVNGAGEFYAPNGDGSMTLLGSYTGWDKTWKTIVPLDRLATSSGSSRSVLLFYSQTQ